MGHDSTLPIVRPGVEGDLAACRSLPIVATACACARGGGAHRGNCPAVGRIVAAEFPASSPMHVNVRARLLARTLVVDDPDACWTWQGSRTKKSNGPGYGEIAVGGKVKHTHRLALEMATGSAIPPRMMALHRCKLSKGCNRPSHLYIGDGSRNALDAVRDGTAFGLRCAGEKNPNRKLTEVQAALIRARAAAGEKRRALAREFGVSYVTVHYITTGERWSHLAGAVPPRRKQARAA